MKRSGYFWMCMLSLLVVGQVFATDYIFMGFDESTQKMQAIVRGDAPFRAVITYSQSNPSGYIGDVVVEEVRPMEQWGEAELSPVDPARQATLPDGEMNVITATAILYDDEENVVGEVVTRDTLFAVVDGHVGVYQYNRDVQPVLPDSIRRSDAHCVNLSHGTYRVPIVCDFPSPNGSFPDPSDVEVYVENGCQNAYCQEVCNPIDWNLFTWFIRSREDCRITLIMTYCDGEPGCICIWRSDEDLPVEFTGFNAVAGDGSVAINWATASESELSRFKVVRSTDPSNPMSWHVVGTVPARNTATGESYRWVDEDVSNGTTYYYKLHVIDAANQSSVYNINGDAVMASATPNSGSMMPVEFSLAQNYPNPFNGNTSFAFSIPTAEHVTLKVFDVMGREVATVLNGRLAADNYTVNWSAEGLATGVYLYTLTAGDFTESRKFLFLK